MSKQYYSYSFFRKGKPVWFTSLPFSDSPGVLAFVVATARAVILSYVVILALYPYFSWRHEESFEFSTEESFFFAFIFAFFEDHARWNYIVNAARPLLAATKFAVFLSVCEFLFSYLAQVQNGSASFLYLVQVRMPAFGMHLLLGCIAACVYAKSQYLMFSVFILSVVVHCIFNIFGPEVISAWVN